MKFILIVWVCSFMAGSNCYQPMKFPMMYDSWYECSRDAHKQSLKVLSTIGFKQVNDLNLGTKYHCQQVRTYWQYHPATSILESFKIQPWSLFPVSWYVAIFSVILWPWLKQSGSMLLSIGKVMRAPVARMMSIFNGMPLKVHLIVLQFFFEAELILNGFFSTFFFW